MKISTKRTLVRLSVFVLVGIGVAFNIGTGTLSAIGFDNIAALCPLGALESLFGSWAFIPRVVIALVAAALIVLVFGKAFCSWVCPVPPVWKFFRGRRRKEKEAEEQAENARMALKHSEEDTAPVRQSSFGPRHGILLGALLSTAVFGFPVFCLVCPIGLTFATFLALWHLFAWSQPSWSLLVFPAILLLEVLLFRKWCHVFCPLGALISLVASHSKTFRPHVDASACKRSAGVACNVCSAVCPELIDPHDDKGMRPLDECTKCGQCVDSCPSGALSIPMIDRSKSSDRAEVETDAS